MNLSTGYLAADLARWIALSLTGWNLAATTVIVVQYRRAYRRVRLALPRDQQWHGLLPRHVYLLGSSHMGLQVVLTFVLIERVREPPTWRTWTILTCYVTTAVALHSLHRYYEARRRAVFPPPRRRRIRSGRR